MLNVQNQLRRGPKSLLDQIYKVNEDLINPEMRHYIPIEVRKENYRKVRARIMGSSEVPKEKESKIKKVRQKFKDR